MSAGDLDPTFGAGGKTAIGFAAHDVAVDSVGRSIVVGQLHGNFAMVRLNADGSIDRTFGTSGSGIHETDFGGERFDRADRVTIQSDGKILVAGLRVKSSGTGTPVNAQFALARYNSNGTLDASFGHAGKTTVLGLQKTSGITGLGIQPSGKIIFSSSVPRGGDFDFIVFRLATSGALDDTFGEASGDRFAGYVTAGLGGEDRAAAQLIEPDGKIVVGGSRFTLDDRQNQFALARFTANGKLDKTFDGDGKLSTTMVRNSVLHDITEQPDGKIVTVGSFDDPNHHASVLIRRFNHDGTTDQQFNHGSVVMRPSSSSVSSVARSVFFRGNKIVIVGADEMALDTSRFSRAFAGQFNYDGTPDNTFGNSGNGVAFFDLGGQALSPTAAIAPDGNMVFAYTGFGISSGVARFTQAVPLVLAQFDDFVATEGSDPAASIVFGRDGRYDFPTRVYFNIRGTATYGKDYKSTFSVTGGTVGTSAALVGTGFDPPLQGFVDIPAFQLSVTVPITIVDDNLTEPTERASFILADDPHYLRHPEVHEATVDILDNDPVSTNFQSPPVRRGLPSRAARLFSDNTIDQLLSL
jgi:uncharacterized delta-60 repeat protein